jgi:hypothetical protein
MKRHCWGKARRDHRGAVRRSRRLPAPASPRSRWRMEVRGALDIYIYIYGVMGACVQTGANGHDHHACPCTMRACNPPGTAPPTQASKQAKSKAARSHVRPRAHTAPTCLHCTAGMAPGAQRTAGTSSFRHPFGIWKRRYITGVFTLLGALLFMDQNLLAPNVRTRTHTHIHSARVTDPARASWITAHACAKAHTPEMRTRTRIRTHAHPRGGGSQRRTHALGLRGLSCRQAGTRTHTHSRPPTRTLPLSLSLSPSALDGSDLFWTGRRTKGRVPRRLRFGSVLCCWGTGCADRRLVH